MELQSEFKHLEPFTFGPELHKQFYKHQEKIYCLRNSCEGCKFNASCKFKVDKLETNPSPNVRRAMAVENESFLILKSLIPIKDIPILSDTQKLSYYPANLHFLKQSKKDKIFLFKKQVRFYGSLNEFETSQYTQYFKYIKSYTPNQRIYSFDYSAIEPRLATLVIKEQKWIDVFKGSEKIVAKEVTGLIGDYTKYDKTEINSSSNKPFNDYTQYLEEINNKLYCILKGELDKVNYEDQCKACKFKDSCKTIKNYIRPVAGDWHSKNAEAFYQNAFINETDKNVKKDMRTVAKIGGLALIYGAFENTLARTLGCSIDEAKVLRNNFFNGLPAVKQYMSQQKVMCSKQKTVKNMFNRNYNLEQLLNNVDKKFKYKADNISLNHPIQSLGADFLKFGILKSIDFIKKNKLSPYTSIDIDEKNKNSLNLTPLSTVHDEVVFLISDDHEINIPDIYTELRLDSLLDSFKAGFNLELDCEYDNYRAWTASNRYETSKIFLLTQLTTSINSAIDTFNILLIDVADLTKNILTSLINLQVLENGVKIGIIKDSLVFISDFIINQKSLDSLNIKYKPAYSKKLN